MGTRWCGASASQPPVWHTAAATRLYHLATGLYHLATGLYHLVTVAGPAGGIDAAMAHSATSNTHRTTRSTHYATHSALRIVPTHNSHSTFCNTPNTTHNTQHTVPPARFQGFDLVGPEKAGRGHAMCQHHRRQPCTASTSTQPAQSARQHREATNACTRDADDESQPWKRWPPHIERLLTVRTERKNIESSISVANPTAARAPACVPRLRRLRVTPRNQGYNSSVPHKVFLTLRTGIQRAHLPVL